MPVCTSQMKGRKATRFSWKEVLFSPETYFGILIGLLVIVPCTYAVWRIVAARSANNELARLRAAGQPTSRVELSAWIAKVPDAENGALVMQRAFALLRKLPDTNDQLLVEESYLGRTDDWPSATRELVEEFLQTNEAALAKAREAFKYSRFRYPLDFTTAVLEEEPTHWRYLKELASMASKQAALEADRNDASGWLKQVDFQLE